MRKFLISGVVVWGAASFAFLGIGATATAAYAAAPEGCIAGSPGTSGTDGGYVVIGALQGSGAGPSSVPSVSATCAYQATVAATGYSAAGTYTITYGAGTLNSAGTACTFTSTTTVISGSAAPPTAVTGGPNVAGDCVQVKAGP